MRQRGLEFGLAARERRRIIEMFDTLRAIRLDDDQLEAFAALGGACFTADESALPFIKPNHFNQPLGLI